jgi:hypothetical protein
MACKSNLDAGPCSSVRRAVAPDHTSAARQSRIGNLLKIFQQTSSGSGLQAITSVAIEAFRYTRLHATHIAYHEKEKSPAIESCTLLAQSILGYFELIGTARMCLLWLNSAYRQSGAL